MDLRSYLRALRKSWWVLLLFVVLGVAGGMFRNAQATRIYASHVTFYVSTPAATDANALSADQFAQRRTNSYVELLSSDRLANAVVSQTGLSVSPGVIKGEISGSAQPNTVLLKATVKDPSPSRALAIAQGVATTFPTMVDGLDNRGLRTSTVVLNVVSGPTTSHTPVLPRKSLNITFGVGIGLIIGLVLAVLRELRDNTVRNIDALRAATDMGVIGDIPFDSAAKNEPLVVGSQLRGKRAEALRQLRTNLQFVNPDRPAKVIVVTSSTAGEGKSMTSTNLAVVFAEAGWHVLLIEADMRRPRAMDYLGIERAVGLTNVLIGQVSVDEVLQTWGSDGLHVLPSGSLPPNPSELLNSQNMEELIANLRTRFDMIIIDTPPLLPVTDAAVVSVLADGAVVVVRHGKTSRAQLTAALQSLDSVGARVLGTVLNMSPRKRWRARDGYDGYGYYEDLPTADKVAGHSGRALRNGRVGRGKRQKPAADTESSPQDKRASVPKD
ncbi:MAG: protein tyrosine kinase [Pseudonocardiales bacterium]|nr:protein tyrosine kinase [Pseudonocardiales bacterium]